MDWTDLWRHASTVGRGLAQFFGAGPVHRRRLADVDTRIVVSGSRGKSTVVRWLHDVFHERGYDTYAKVTGTTPVSIHNGTEHEIPRPEQVRLYENERELRKYTPVDVAIFENQGIRQYTTRLVTQEFVRPDVVFLTNVREDHLGTLGNDRFSIARALVRAVPPEIPIVSGEQDPAVRRYIDAESRRRGGEITHVELPPRLTNSPGMECVHGLNEVLAAVDEPPLSWRRIQTYRRQFGVSWRRLEGGLVYNASDANDVQSTELIRNSLTDRSSRVIEPIIFLRWDRRGRTASFLQYLEELADDGVLERVHVIGTDRRLFARQASFPVLTYDPETEPPGAVLDSALEAGYPVLVMGNTVDEFMDAMQREIEARTIHDGSRRVEDTEPDDGWSRFRRHVYTGAGHHRRRRGRRRFDRLRAPTEWRGADTRVDRETEPPNSRG